MNKNEKPKRRKSGLAPKKASGEKIDHYLLAQEVDAGWRHFWKKRGRTPPPLKHY